MSWFVHIFLQNEHIVPIVDALLCSYLDLGIILIFSMLMPKPCSGDFEDGYYAKFVWKNTIIYILLFIIEAIHGVMVSPQCFNILGPILSFPLDLFMSNLSIIFLTSKDVINEMLVFEPSRMKFSLSVSDETFCS